MKRLILILIAVVWASNLQAAITVDRLDGFTTTTTITTHTFTGFIVANQDNRFFVNVIGYDGALETTLTSSTFNGDALTKNTGASLATAVAAVLLTYYRVAPDVATGDIVANLNNAQNASQYGISLYGVDQSNPFRDSDEEQGTTATSTGDLTLTTVSGDFVVSCLFQHGSGGAPGGSLTQDSGTLIEQLLPKSSLRTNCSYQTASGTSTTVGWSGWSSVDAWVHVAFAIAPSGAPAIIFKRYYDMLRSSLLTDSSLLRSI